MQKVAICTINYTSKKETLSLLKNLESLNGDFEVFVLENGSPNNFIKESDLPKTKYKIHFFKSAKNLGYAGGNNLIIKNILDKNFDYYWLLNNDTQIEKDTLALMLDTYKVKKDAGIVGCLVIQDMDKVWWAGSKLDLKRGKITKKYYGIDFKDVKKGIFKTDEVNGAMMLIKKEVVAKIGLLDTVFFHTAEDTDYSIRAKLAGFGLYVNTNAKVFHSIGKSSGGAYSPMHMFFVERGRLMLMRKWKKLNFISFTFLLPLWCKRILAPIIRKGDFKSSLYTVKGIVEGLTHPV